MNPTTNQPPDLFTRLGMVSATDEQKREVAERLADMTMIRVMEKIEPMLSPEQLQMLEQMSDAGGEDMEARLIEWVPGYEQIVQDTASQMADQLVADQQAVLGQVRSRASQQY